MRQTSSVWLLTASDSHSDDHTEQSQAKTDTDKDYTFYTGLFLPGQDFHLATSAQVSLGELSRLHDPLCKRLQGQCFLAPLSFICRFYSLYVIIEVHSVQHRAS